MKPWRCHRVNGATLMRQLVIASLLLVGSIGLFIYAFQQDLPGEADAVDAGSGEPSVNSNGDQEAGTAETAPATASVDPHAEQTQTDPRLQGMVWIPDGQFVMGTEEGAPDKIPPHEIHLTGFWMDATEVTNRQFQQFVDATGYVTLPEQKTELRSIQAGSGLEDVKILDEFNVPGSICSLQLNSRADSDPERGAY
ncbi:MAG: SUMF1/EgtB/PvdO family nonheme iron enzyme, partial [Planctomycetaceae bacterium]|nr:SUMF1/EgtB/PvdO family nonheme iron enzyme [Planctomycetaceae bacterium]